MNRFMLTLPALALSATVALAQTDTTGGTTGTDAGTGAAVGVGAGGDKYGTNWPLSVGTTFFTDGESSTLRSAEELSTGWQSLSQEDRDMILADCETFRTDHGVDGASAASTEGTAGAASDTGTATATATAEGSGTGDATTATGTDAATTTAETGATSTSAGYDMAQMMAICEAAQQF
jgi:hypothetical protein